MFDTLSIHVDEISGHVFMVCSRWRYRLDTSVNEFLGDEPFIFISCCLKSSESLLLYGIFLGAYSW